MSLKFKNPLAVPVIAAQIDALPAEFSLCISVQLNDPQLRPSWHPICNDALQRMFVCERPEDIEPLSLSPVLWFAAPEPSRRHSVTFHGFAKLPFPNLCGTAFTTSMCRPTRLYLQSEMTRAGIDCLVGIEHAGMTLNAKQYDRQWQVDAAGAIWNYVGKASAGGIYDVRRRPAVVRIVPERHSDGLEWLFGGDDSEVVQVAR